VPHIGRDLAGQVEQVVIDEEEAAEPVVLDQPQLLGESPLCFIAVHGAHRVALVEARATQLGERPRRRGAVGAVEIGKAIP